MRWPAAASFILATAIGAAPPADAQIAAAAPAPAADDAPQSPGEAAQSLRDVVARYLAWRGPAFAQLQTIHERLQIDTPAGHVEGGLWMDRDGRMRRELRSDAGAEVEVDVADGGWRIGPAISPDAPQSFERSRRYALLAFGDALMGRGGAKVELAGKTEFEDHAWTVVRATFGDADRYEALLDPEIGLLCCYRITEGGVTRTELFGEWRLVDGVRMPFAEATRADREVDARVTAVELNRPFDATLFRRPDAGG